MIFRNQAQGAAQRGQKRRKIVLLLSGIRPDGNGGYTRKMRLFRTGGQIKKYIVKLISNLDPAKQ